MEQDEEEQEPEEMDYSLDTLMQLESDMPTSRINLKRRIDFYFTPVNVKRHCRQLTDTMKQEILDSGGSLSLKSGLSAIGSEANFPVPLKKYLQPLNSYSIKSTVSRQKFPVLHGQTSFSEDKIFKPTASQFVEAVITTPSIWILIIQVDIFYTK